MLTTAPPTRQKSVMQSFGTSVQKGLADFFLGEEERQHYDVQTCATKWRSRYTRLKSNPLVGGKVRDEYSVNKNRDEQLSLYGARSFDTLDNSVFEASHGDEAALRRNLAAAGRKTPQPYDPLAIPRRQMSRSSKGSAYGGPALSRQYSHISTASSSRRSMRVAPSRRYRKQSVLGLAVTHIKAAGKGGNKTRKPTIHSRSYAPGSLSTFMDDAESMKKPSPAAESFTPGVEEIDDVFFDIPNPTSPYVQMRQHPLARFMPSTPVPQASGEDSLVLPAILERSRTSEIREESVEKRTFDDGDGKLPEDTVPFATYSHAEADDSEDASKAELRVESGRKRGSRPPPLSIEIAAQGDASTAVKVDEPEDDTDLLEPTETLIHKPIKGGWQKGRLGPQPAPGTPDYILDQVDSAHLVDGIDNFGRAIKVAMTDWDNSDRREIGKGFVGNLFEREYREYLPSEVEEQIEEMDEHRPYFTYWATFVQIVIYIVAVAVYGIAPIGFEDTEISAEVLKPSLAIERVSYLEQDNLWIGPRQADLIHLGARYSPCMRADDNVIAAIKQDRDVERGSACCIRNDGSGCHQTTYATCSSTLSLWVKWTDANPGPDGRLSGSVCGQDPHHCNEPLSTGSYTWPDDITQWPICRKSVKASPKPENAHMTCSLVGRPCCVGIQGACIITTREYCTFRKGYFHEEAALCSQVDCMSEICGMIPFLNPDKPDQFYRLWTSLFLHAGLFQLVVTVLFQFFVMRDVEKLAGWHRTAIIYIGSGIAGSLASAIFLPYHVEAGPAGSQFGIIACLFAELLQNWTILKHPCCSLFKQLCFLVVLFIMGLLPYVDNYAHLFGFIFGFLLAFALLPFINFNKCDRRGKVIGIIVCLVAASGVFALLIVLFYVVPIYNCPNCHYFNCIPFTNKFCRTMEVRIGRTEIY